MPPALSRQSLLLVYLLALALLWGNAYRVLVNHPAAYTVAEQSYLRLAQGDFAVPAAYRYEVVVPLLASSLAHGARGLANLISPADKPPFGFSFFLVNSLLLAGAGWYAFRAARAARAGAGAALLGMTALLTCGAATVAAGLVRVDSGLALVVALLYYAVLARSAPALLAAAVVGPLVAGSFLLFLPLVAWYGGFAPRGQRLLATLAGLLLLAAVHGAVDARTGGPGWASSLTSAFAPEPGLLGPLGKLMSFHGLGSSVGAYGLFTGILLAGFGGGKQAVRQWLQPLRPGPALLLLLAGLAHGLLPGEVSLPLLAGPPVVVALALILDRHPFFATLRGRLGSRTAPETV